MEIIEELTRKLEHALNNADLINNVDFQQNFGSQYLQQLLNNVYVIETETGAVQGSAFYLKGVGIVTCDHCVRSHDDNVYINDLVIYRGDDLKNKAKVKVSKSNQHIDPSILEIITESEAFLKEGLKMGNSDILQHLDDIAVAGYPNYNYNDSLYITLGRITDIRTISGIAHVMVSNTLVAGNSGEPALNRDGELIGIVVIGSETFESARNTEKHGLIPINTINMLG